MMIPRFQACLILVVAHLLHSSIAFSASSDFPYHFDKEPFIHPTFIEDLKIWQSSTGFINVADLQDENLFKSTITVEYRRDKNPFVYKEAGNFFGYQYIGQTGTGIDILLISGGEDGSGRYQSLMLLKFKVETGLTYSADDGDGKDNNKRVLVSYMGSIPLGYRYLGDIKLTGNTLTIGEDLNSADLLFAKDTLINFSDSNKVSPQIPVALYNQIIEENSRHAGKITYWSSPDNIIFRDIDLNNDQKNEYVVFGEGPAYSGSFWIYMENDDGYRKIYEGFGGVSPDLNDFEENILKSTSNGWSDLFFRNEINHGTYLTFASFNGKSYSNLKEISFSGGEITENHEGSSVESGTGNFVRNENELFAERKKCNEIFAQNLSHKIFQQFVLPLALQNRQIALQDQRQVEHLDKIVRESLKSLPVNEVTVFATKENIISYSTDSEKVGKTGLGGEEYLGALEGQSSTLIGPDGVIITYYPLRKEKPFSKEEEVMGVIMVERVF